MEKQQTLFQMTESFNLNHLEEDSLIAVKKRLKQLPDQSTEEFEEELRDEVFLEIAYRLRKIADEYEEKALKEQKEMIRLVYNEKGKLTIKD